MPRSGPHTPVGPIALLLPRALQRARGLERTTTLLPVPLLLAALPLSLRIAGLAARQAPVVLALQGSRPALGMANIRCCVSVLASAMPGAGAELTLAQTSVLQRIADVPVFGCRPCFTHRPELPIAHPEHCRPRESLPLEIATKTGAPRSMRCRPSPAPLDWAAPPPRRSVTGKFDSRVLGFRSRKAASR